MSPRHTPLTAAEQETIIRFDETQAPANVFTYNRRWQKHMEGKLGIKPNWRNSKGGKEYELPKSRISLPRAPRQYSEAALTRLRARAKTMRQQQPSQRTAKSKSGEGEAR